VKEKKKKKKKKKKEEKLKKAHESRLFPREMFA